MAESQTWRVVLAPRTPDGAAEERQLTVVWVERFGGTWTCGGHGYHRSPRRAAMMAAFTLDYDVAEILAPGEPTRAELAAEVAHLRAENATLRASTDAAVDGVRAMLPAALATARREGAELAEALVDAFWPTINAKRIDLIERDIAGTITHAESALLAQLQAAAEVAGRAFSAGLLAALPLDAPGGAT